MATTRKSTTARLHLLSARQVLNAADGDHSDGGGLLLRVGGNSCSWVYRYTTPGGKRREMGLGVAHRGSLAQAGQALTDARDAAHAARTLVRDGIDPIDAREGRREAERQAGEAKRAVQARERWT